MVKDVVPELLTELEQKRQTNVMKDGKLLRVAKRIDSGQATLQDVHTYAERLGVDLSDALVSTLTADNLPNGTLYYNIAERTVLPALENNYDLVNEAAEKAQKAMDKKAKIGLGSVKADFPKDRVQHLIDKLTADDITADDVIRWLSEPIVNNSEAFVDDYVEANASFRSKAGLKTKIIRRAEAKCCDWCSDLEGEYDYETAPADIYRRHENCRCLVTYKSEKISQNVWSKRKWETPKEDLTQRQQAGQKKELSAQDRLDQLHQIERDAQIKQFAKETGYSRKASQQATKGKTPEQIAADIKKIKERQQIIRG